MIGLAAALVSTAASLSVRADDPGKNGIVCWTDDHGQRACGDHVPPQYARKQREVYNGRGVLVRTLQAEETPEQRAEDERKERDAQRAQQQQQNDNFMLQTYRNVDELKAVRDSRLQTLDTRIDLAERAVRDGAGSVKDLQDRADVERSAGRDVGPELLGQIKVFEGSQADNIRALAQVKQDRDATASEFEREILRYQEMRGGAAATPAPPSTPQPPTPPAAPMPQQAPKP
ncbi:MAG: hypothetical protein ACHQIO_11450 [Nevskiales bacterium]